jgi:endoglucanase
MRRAVVVLVLGAVTVLAAGGSVQVARSAVTSAFVRVNQVGYPGNATKRAYLMSSAAETGATFSVTNARGSVVYTAPIGASLGA